MPSTHLSLQYHLIFSTKHRFPFIEPAWRKDLHRFLGACVKELGGVPLEINGVADHVHLLAGLKSRHCLADVLCDIKSASSRWVHDQIGVRKFAWQEGYGGFTVCQRDAPVIRRYIAGQEEHHRGRTFQDEYRALLDEQGVAFDERFLW